MKIPTKVFLCFEIFRSHVHLHVSMEVVVYGEINRHYVLIYCQYLPVILHLYFYFFLYCIMFCFANLSINRNFKVYEIHFEHFDYNKLDAIEWMID